MIVEHASHRAELQGRELLVLRLTGVLRPDDLSGLLARVRPSIADRSTIDMLFDMRDLHMLPGDTRRRLADEIRGLPLRAAAFVGGDFSLRVIGTIVMRMLDVERAERRPVRFFDDEAEALRWLADRGTAPGAAASDPAVVVDVSRSRIDKLILALSCASFDQFDVPDAEVHVETEDDFGLLEGVFQLFIDELSVTKIMLGKSLAESEAARDELERRLGTIEDQRRTIEELSIPIIDAWDGVLTLPIVGTIDSQRAADMSDQLLVRVAATRAHSVILDLTGVEVVDTGTAAHLVTLIRATELLGTRCVLTGIGPQVATTMASLGLDLGGVRTLRTLKDGLRLCIRESEQPGARHPGSRSPTRR
ncbi:MAG: STAS domain-containing protein [Byssovorax sp.]